MNGEIKRLKEKYINPMMARKEMIVLPNSKEKVNLTIRHMPDIQGYVEYKNPAFAEQLSDKDKAIIDGYAMGNVVLVDQACVRENAAGTEMVEVGGVEGFLNKEYGIKGKYMVLIGLMLLLIATSEDFFFLFVACGMAYYFIPTYNENVVRYAKAKPVGTKGTKGAAIGAIGVSKEPKPTAFSMGEAAPPTPVMAHRRTAGAYMMPQLTDVLSAMALGDEVFTRAGVSKDQFVRDVNVVTDGKVDFTDGTHYEMNSHVEAIQNVNFVLKTAELVRQEHQASVLGLGEKL